MIQCDYFGLGKLPAMGRVAVRAKGAMGAHKHPEFDFTEPPAVKPAALLPSETLFADTNALSHTNPHEMNYTMQYAWQKEDTCICTAWAYAAISLA